MEIQNINMGGGLQMSSASPGGSIVTGNLTMQVTPSSYVGSGYIWNDTRSNVSDVNAYFYNGNVTVSNAETIYSYNSQTGFTIPNTNNNVNKCWIFIPSVELKTSFTQFSSYSVEMWINISPMQRQIQTVVLSKRTTQAGSKYPYSINYQNYDNRSFLSFAVSDDIPGHSQAIVDIEPVPTNTWIQIVGVWNWVGSNTDQIPVGNMGAYMNGQFKGLDSLSELTGSISNNLDVGVGGWYQLPVGIIPDYFYGQVGVIRFYDKALSGAEVFQNFQATRTQFSI